MILFSTVTFVLSLVCSGRLRNLPSNKKYVYTYNKNICLTYLIHIVANLQVLMSCTYNTLSGIFRLPELRKGSWEPYGESLYPSLIPTSHHHHHHFLPRANIGSDPGMNVRVQRYFFILLYMYFVQWSTGT